MNVLTATDIQGNLRRLENLTATKNFADALENLNNNPKELDEAIKNPKAYLNGFGLMIPEEAKVTIKTESGMTAGDFQAQGVCVIACSGNTCLIVCVVPK